MARRSMRARPARILCVWLAFAWSAAAAGPARAGNEPESAETRVEISPLLRPDEERPMLLTTVPEPEQPGPR